jgi:beta-glucosidase
MNRRTRNHATLALAALLVACGTPKAPKAGPSAHAEPFWWGAATSPYQVEDPGQGAFKTDWDLFYEKGQLRHPRGEGVHSWTEMKRDREALGELAVSHYRFGIEWARIEPSPGEYDDAALARYVEHAAALRAQGIEPVICLWHFTFPDWGTKLDDPSGNGWLHPQVQQRWGAYVERVARAMAPHVSWYAPQNEPNAQAMAGYFLGIWPPGVANDLDAVTAQTAGAAERFIEAATILRANDEDARIMTVQNIIAFDPQAWDQVGIFTRIGEHYNYDHLDAVAETTDFIGFNYYYRRDASPFPAPERTWPRGIRVAIEALDERYHKPIVVTENGLGTAFDSQRQAYLRAHIRQVMLAREAGHDVRGYFAWSFVDNYEWALGWDVDYGMMYEDPATRELVAKPSFEFYRSLAAGERSPR